MAVFPHRIRSPRTCPLISLTIAFLQLSLTLSIQRSHFGRFCTISAFDSRLLPGFAQSLHSTVAFWQLVLSAFSHSAPAPRSRIRSHFCSFHSLSAFNGRVLAGFAQSLHSTVAVWQLFLSAFSHSAPAPRSYIRSHFGSFHSLSAFNGRILAGFAQSLHSTVAFWQVLHNLCIRRSRLAAFPLRILPLRTCPHFSHMIAFLQLSLTLCIQRSHFGRFCTILAFDGRVLAGFAQSLLSTVAFGSFSSPHSPTPHLPPVLA